MDPLSFSPDCVGPRLGKASVFIATYLRKDYVEWIVCSFFFFLFSLQSGIFHRWNSANRSVFHSLRVALTTYIMLYQILCFYLGLLVSRLIFYPIEWIYSNALIPREAIKVEKNSGEIDRAIFFFLFFHPRKRETGSIAVYPKFVRLTSGE